MPTISEHVFYKKLRDWQLANHTLLDMGQFWSDMTAEGMFFDNLSDNSKALAEDIAVHNEMYGEDSIWHVPFTKEFIRSVLSEDMQLNTVAELKQKIERVPDLAALGFYEAVVMLNRSRQSQSLPVTMEAPTGVDFPPPVEVWPESVDGSPLDTEQLEDYARWLVQVAAGDSDHNNPTNYALDHPMVQYWFRVGNNGREDARRVVANLVDEAVNDLMEAVFRAEVSHDANARRSFIDGREDVLFRQMMEWFRQTNNSR